MWAGPGLLAAATEEKIIRLFDLATDESYNLSMNNALGRMMDRADRVVCVTFSPVDRYGLFSCLWIYFQWVYQ